MLKKRIQVVHDSWTLTHIANLKIMIMWLAPPWSRHYDYYSCPVLRMDFFVECQETA